MKAVLTYSAHTETGLSAHTDVRLNKNQYVSMKIHTQKKNNMKALTSENEARGKNVLLAGILNIHLSLKSPKVE